ncbi:MAG TPA: thioredoxin TrxC [Woeseiaceae bacterium]
MSTSHIVCPHCDAVNRIPSERLADAPKCGSCHAPLFGEQPKEVDGAGLRRQVERNDIPVVVDFWAPWCGPCRMMAPEFERASAELGAEARLLKLNTDQEQELAGQLGIRGIPTMILFVNGREAARRSGAMRSADIVRWVREQARAVA